QHFGGGTYDWFNMTRHSPVFVAHRNLYFLVVYLNVKNECSGTGAECQLGRCDNLVVVCVDFVRSEVYLRKVWTKRGHRVRFNSMTDVSP
ncbi:hypothetical protein, partial [Lacticaseibacillus rhamnosus]|uniref:hypothetical protein n=1 Tax=Lacticaseibacillus rhamnosus TaxID=47715 RepID=UPI0019D3ED61